MSIDLEQVLGERKAAKIEAEHQKQRLLAAQVREYFEKALTFEQREALVLGIDDLGAYLTYNGTVVTIKNNNRGYWELVWKDRNGAILVCSYAGPLWNGILDVLDTLR